jgi:hypothetical protein
LFFLNFVFNHNIKFDQSVFLRKCWLFVFVQIILSIFKLYFLCLDTFFRNVNLILCCFGFIKHIVILTDESVKICNYNLKNTHFSVTWQPSPFTMLKIIRCVHLLFLNYLWILNMYYLFRFHILYCRICEVSPEMKEQKNFLFVISGGTCHWIIAVSSNLICSIYNSVFPLQYKRFLVSLNICVLFIVYSTYQNHKVIILIFGIRSYLGGFVEL